MKSNKPNNMKNKVPLFLSIRIWAVACLAMLVLIIPSCHSSKNTHKATETQDWFSWSIEFKRGTTKDQMMRAVDDIEKSINRDYPLYTINYHIATGESEDFILIQARMAQGYSSPKKGGPKHPGFMPYNRVSPYVKNITQSNENRAGMEKR